MRRLHTHIDEIRIENSIPQNSQLLWQNDKLALYYNFDSKEGRVDWIMQNKQIRQYLYLFYAVQN